MVIVVVSSNEEGLSVRETLGNMVERAIEYGAVAVGPGATEYDRVRYWTWRAATVMVADALGERAVALDIAEAVARYR